VNTRQLNSLLCYRRNRSKTNPPRAALKGATQAFEAQIFTYDSFVVQYFPATFEYDQLRCNEAVFFMLALIPPFYTDIVIVYFMLVVC